jgi:hypothetical protein
VLDTSHLAPTPHNKQPTQQQQQQQQRGPHVCLAAVPRSFHCKARQDCPMPAAGEALLGHKPQHH